MSSCSRWRSSPREIFVVAGSELVVVCEGKTVYNDDFTEILEHTNGQVVFLNPSFPGGSQRIELDTQIGSATESQSAYYDDVSGELYVIST